METYEDVFILLYVHRLGEDKILNSHCNVKKKWMSERYKLAHKSSKKVNQFTKDDVFIKTWDCMMDVERELSINHRSISLVCRGKRNHAGGFKWRFN